MTTIRSLNDVIQRKNERIAYLESLSEENARLSGEWEADYLKAQARNAELEAENAALRRQQWQPICEETIPTSHPDGDGVGTTVSTECAPELWGSRQSIQISTWDDNGFYHASVVLPDDIRLCRKVEA